MIRRVDELSDEDRSVLVDDVLVQLQELTDLVGDLAELARGDQQPSAAEPLRLDLLVQDAVAVQSTHGRAHDVTFHLEAEPCWVQGHGDRIGRAVGNLLDNARKWSPAGQTVVGGVAGTGRWWCATTARHRRGGPAPHLRPLLPLPGRPRAAGVAASAWPSWPRW